MCRRPPSPTCRSTLSSSSPPARSCTSTACSSAPSSSRPPWARAYVELASASIHLAIASRI
eukprot:1643453-Alexandrium_andersonii.AAC.1